jgi:hypothetical protein
MTEARRASGPPEQTQEPSHTRHPDQSTRCRGRHEPARLTAAFRPWMNTFGLGPASGACTGSSRGHVLRAGDRAPGAIAVASVSHRGATDAAAHTSGSSSTASRAGGLREYQTGRLLASAWSLRWNDARAETGTALTSALRHVAGGAGARREASPPAPKISGAALPRAVTVLPPTVALSRTCRCTPSETPRALIRRASHMCAALLFAAVFSLEPVYLCVQKLGGRAHLPADSPPPLPQVRLRTLPDERQIPRQREPQAPRRLAPRAVHRMRGHHQTHCLGADERAFRTTRAPEPAARQQPRRGSRTTPGSGRTPPRRARLGSNRAAGLAVAVRSAAAPGAPRPVGACAGVGLVSVRFAAGIPVRPVRLSAEGFGSSRA